jgi:glycerol-3-phosphate dehydrogenase
MLARRTRALLLNARANVEVAPTVATIMAQELRHGDNWISSQIVSYKSLSKQLHPLLSATSSP